MNRKLELTDTRIKELIDRMNEYEAKEYGEHAMVHKVEGFTCHTCEDKRTCESSFDAYNTGGDCLESK